MIRKLNEPEISENVIALKRSFKCAHNKFVVDPELDYVECGICGERLNPIWVICEFANREHRANQRIRALNEIAEKAIQKNRCKCEHCGKMTRIQK